MNKAAPKVYRLIPHPYTGPRIGMLVEEAVAIMRKAWSDELSAADHAGVNGPVKRLSNQLHRTLRDCGWCLGHLGADERSGNKCLQRAHDLAIAGMKGREGYRFSRAIDWAFSGIAGWWA
jgi:hypothetical protein